MFDLFYEVMMTFIGRARHLNRFISIMSHLLKKKEGKLSSAGSAAHPNAGCSTTRSVRTWKITRDIDRTACSQADISTIREVHRPSYAMRSTVTRLESDCAPKKYVKWETDVGTCC